MPEYSAPGVYVEETGFRSKSITGAATSTTGFVGQTAFAPPDVGPPPLLTSAQDFERLYGGADDLVFDGVPSPNYMAGAVRAFFDQGGRRLHVAPASGPTAAAHAAALDRLLTVEDISIVAAPAAAALQAEVLAEIHAALVAHAETAGAYRFAVLDPPPDRSVAQVQALRAAYDSRQAALYYPWLVVADPPAGDDPARPPQIALPPSGFVCGVYARTDAQRGVWKAPANEELVGVVRPQARIDRAHREALNPLGVNCISYFEGRGLRVWGARTLSSDPEAKYVNVRRFLTYLEASLDRGTRWAAFEPNGEQLWADLRATVSDFLHGAWRSGALLGDKPEDAYFVRCDRAAMTQAYIDAGRLVCLVGVALMKPAEFVILRISQKTADAA